MSQAAGFFTNSGPGGFVQTLQGNTGPVVPPLAGNINVVGDGTTITVAGNAGTHTLTISLIGASGYVKSITTDDGHVVTPAAGTIILHGTHGLNTTGTVGPNTATVAINNRIVLGDLAVIPATVGAVELVTGDLVVDAGNIQMPFTNTTGTVGVYEMGTFPFLHAGGPVNGAVGPDNVFLGGSAGIFNTTAAFCVGIGRQTLQDVTGNNNTCVGAVSATSIISSTQCTSLGASAIDSLVSGSNVIALGYRAGALLAGAESNDIYIGNTGILAESDTIRIGTNAVQTATYIVGIAGVDLNTATVVTENSDQLGTAVLTAGAGISITPGAGIITIAATGGGVTSIAGNTGGPQTGAVSIVTASSTPIFAGVAGTITLDFFQTNLLLGASGIGITTANSNVGYGALAAASLTSGASNCFLGYESGVNSTDGSNSTAVGAFSMFNAISGASNNTAIGYSSLYNLAGAGTDNTCLGINSGSNYSTNESHNILIGNAGVVAESNVTRIGTNSSQIACFIAGIDAIDLSTANIVTESADQLGTTVLTGGTGITVTPGAGVLTIASTVVSGFYTYTNVNATPYVVLTTDLYLSVDASGGAITVQLPNAATLGQFFIIKDRTGSAFTNNITVTTVGGAVNIDVAPTFVMNTNYQSIQVIGNGSTYEVF